MVKRLLIGSIIFLFVIIIAEIFYLFILPKKDIATDPVLTENDAVNALPPITPTLTPIPFTPAINSEQLDWFKKTRSTAHVSSTITQKYKGIVYEIDTKQFKDDNGTVSTVYDLYLTDGNTSDKSQMNSFLITDSVLDIATFTDQETGESFQVTDLKSQDKLNINLTINLSKPYGSNVEQFEIIRSL